MRGNVGLDPTRMQCKDCATDVAPTDLSRAEHRALHLEWAAMAGKFPHPTPDNRREAWRAYSRALEQQASDLRGQICTRDDVIAAAEADYEHVLGELRNLRSQICMRAHQ